MKEFKTVETTTEELVSLTCDKCGLISKINGALPAGVEPYIDTISVYFGYGSKYDQELWEMDVCINCIEKIFKDKKIYTNAIGE